MTARLHQRLSRASIALVAAVGLVVLLIASVRFFSYTHGYKHTYFNPASLDSEQPGYYYLDWREGLGDLEEVRQALGEDGIFRSSRDRLLNGRLYHDPIRVIQAALALHDQLLDAPCAERETILRQQLDWLLGEGMAQLPGGIPVWPHYYRFDRYGLREPWISALTQGQAISLLVRAAQYTGEDRYARTARQAARAFLEPGVPIVWHGAGGEFFYEEYPSLPPSHVLNGCLFAWLGLWDHVRFAPMEGLRAHCLGSMEQIRRRVPVYELGDWTRYDVFQVRPTSPAYQEIHAALAEALGAILSDSFWQERAVRWRAAAANPVRRTLVFFRVLAGKARLWLAQPRAAEGLAPPIEAPTAQPTSSSTED